MMLHQDGSRHGWIPAFDRALDLIITLDDAANEIYSAFLVEEEGTFSSFRGLAEGFALHGLPLSLYSDRGSHYFFTPNAAEKVDPCALTQVGRALAQLGIEHIAAYSPQARDRCERVFRTLQDRLERSSSLPASATSISPIALSAISSRPQRAFCQTTADWGERVRDARRSRTAGGHPVHRGGAGGGSRQYQRP
jgi:transposase InsO family protein